MRCHLNAAGTTSSALAALLVLCTASPAPTQESPALTISAQARALEPGEVVALEVACRCAPPASATAKAFGVEIPLVPLPGDAGWSGLVGIDVDVSPGDYPVTV